MVKESYEKRTVKKFIRRRKINPIMNIVCTTVQYEKLLIFVIIYYCQVNFGV